MYLIENFERRKSLYSLQLVKYNAVQPHSMNYKKVKLTIYGLFAIYTLSAQPSFKLVNAIIRNDTAEVNYWIENNDIDQCFVDKEGNNHLLIASREGHKEIVEILLKAGWDINYQNKEGTTALHVAARNGHLDVVKCLIKNGVSVNTINKSGNTPLFYASSTRNLELVKFLVNNGANVNIFSEEKHTNTVILLGKEHGQYIRDARQIGDSSPMRVNISLPVCQAIFYGDDKIASYLLDAGTSIDILKRDPYQFWEAVSNGLTLTVKKLVKAGVNLNYIIGSTTPLAEAAKIRNLELISLLLENGANPNFISPRYATYQPISAAIPSFSAYKKNELSKEVKDTVTKIVKFLIDHKEKFSFNEFSNAIENELEDVALLMLEQGLDISEKSNAAYDRSDLNYAAFAIKNNCFKLAEIIVNKSSVQQLDFADSESATALMWAIYKNQFTLAKALVKKGANPNKKGVLWVNDDPMRPLYYETPLCIASGMGNLGLVKLLVASGAKINNKKSDQKGFDDWSPIFCSAHSGHTTISKYLIKQKAVLTEKDHGGRTLLHFAAFGEDTALINHLLRLGLSVNATDNYGYTPLHFAAGSNKVQATSLLLKKGADIYKIDKQGLPAWAYCFSAGSIAMVDSLEKIKKIGGIVTKDGLSPLMVACKYKNTKVAQYLLNRVANSKIDKNTRDSVLLSAVKNSDTTILKMILQDTSGINIPYYHKSLMQYAYETYDSSTMSLLLLHGANPSVSMNDENKTPVITRALFGYMKNTVRLLIKSHAELCATDLKGKTFLNYLFADYYDPGLCNLAAENIQVNDLKKINYDDLITLLILCKKSIADSVINKLAVADSSLRSDALHVAASYGSYEVVIKLAKITRNINAFNAEGKTPFHIACENGYLNIAQVLFAYGANINAKDSNKNTPLILACKAGYLDIVKFLVANHADLNLENSEHSSPLFYAASNRYKKLTTFLCSAGADVNASNKYGFTIIHAACRNGDEQLVRTLCNYGAITNLSDKLGKTPFYYAVKNNHLEVVRFLANSKVSESREEIIDMVNTSLQSKNTSLTEVLVARYADSMKHSWNIFLEKAIQADLPSIIEDIIALGGDKNFYFTYNGDRINVIGYCIKNGHWGLAKRLINKGVNITAKAMNNWPPLLLAVDKRNVPLVELLIESGCDVNTEVNIEYDGNYSPLLMAVENEDIEMIKLLINKGAKTGFTNSQGMSILEFAKSKKSNDIIKLLEDGIKN